MSILAILGILLYIFIILGFLGLYIYVLILVIKFLQRGIKAFDKYLADDKVDKDNNININ